MSALGKRATVSARRELGALSPSRYSLRLVAGVPVRGQSRVPFGTVRDGLRCGSTAL